MRKIRKQVKLLTAEVKEEISAIRKDDPDRKWKAFRCKAIHVMQQRRTMDAAAGLSMAEIDRKHKERIKTVMSIAVWCRAVPDRIVRGPAMQESTKTVEEVAQAKQKANRKYKANKAKRENLIRIMLRICFWFTDFLRTGDTIRVMKRKVMCSVRIAPANSWIIGSTS
jgi:hypothetical protein